MISLETAIGIFILAFICEFIDSSLGMMYGTILSPVLIIAGFEPLLVVPSILLSQAIGGFSASLFHHKFKNVSFRSLSQDSKVVYLITASGIIMTFIAITVAVVIPSWALKTYIGLIVLAMGVILLSGIRFSFSWKKLTAIGVLSSFNKGLSGGGFGPVVTCGQVVIGRDPKQAIGSTTLAEAPICLAGFVIYAIMGVVPDLSFLIPMCFGALAVGPIGAYATGKYPRKMLVKLLGILALGLGIWTLIKTWT
jgi:uncharacterized membrane protein YfcA